jgi:23S rRNA (uracil1939-C5)-methyltransferase
MNETLSVLSSLVPADFPLAFVLVSGRAFTLVLKSRRRSDWVEEMKAWEARFPGRSFFVNWHPGAGRRAVDTKRNELIFGSPWLEAGGLVHGPMAFRQQLPEMEEEALGLAEEFLAGAGLKITVDFYSGLGASLRRWGEKGWKTVGVELSGESVAAAEQNAPGVLILRGRVEDRLRQVDEILTGRDFVLYTNPPRSGHAKSVIEWLLARKPKRIAYLSCHPRSLAGDLNALSEGYEVMVLQPLDFFPQTDHAETLALLERR